MGSTLARALSLQRATLLISVACSTRSTPGVGISTTSSGLSMSSSMAGKVPVKLPFVMAGLASRTTGLKTLWWYGIRGTSSPLSPTRGSSIPTTPASFSSPRSTDPPIASTSSRWTPSAPVRATKPTGGGSTSLVTRRWLIGIDGLCLRPGFSMARMNWSSGRLNTLRRACCYSVGAPWPARGKTSSPTRRVSTTLMLLIRCCSWSRSTRLRSAKPTARANSTRSRSLRTTNSSPRRPRSPSRASGSRMR